MPVRAIFHSTICQINQAVNQKFCMKTGNIFIFSPFVGLYMVKDFLPSSYTLRVTRPSYKNISQILELHDPHFIPTCFGLTLGLFLRIIKHVKLFCLIIHRPIIKILSIVVEN